ncbi:hypothetical protein HMI54_014581 [Coelomomyces lativittatus]|nr:hypothetical protein HMI56_001067 [Coelomomyces lativittatus]KAJ1509875.1 hypothetical protein HMI55_007224 [Coelomomyces lativittatus]KAJ1513968.1 hypothetical protein HMI54_014581 [Coelomomyces lativittatus]
MSPIDTNTSTIQAQSTSSYQQITEDIWKFTTTSDSRNTTTTPTCTELTVPNYPVFLPVHPLDQHFQRSDQVFFKYVIRHSNGSLFEDSHEFHPYFPKITGKKTGPCKGMRTAINTMVNGEISSFRFFRNAARPWSQFESLMLDEAFLDAEIEILGIASRDKELPTESLNRAIRTKEVAVDCFKKGEFLRALHLFKAIEYQLLFLKPNLSSEHFMTCAELQARLHCNASQCLLQLSEPHMALTELEAFDEISSQTLLNENLCQKAAYRKCMALMKANRYDEAKLLSTSCLAQFSDPQVFQALLEEIRKAEKNERVLFKKLFDQLSTPPRRSHQNSTKENEDAPIFDKEIKIEPSTPVDNTATSSLNTPLSETESCIPSIVSHLPPKTLTSMDLADSSIEKVHWIGDPSWAQPGDCEADFENIPYPNATEVIDPPHQPSSPPSTPPLPSPLPPLDTILASLDIDEINRTLHQFFYPKHLFAASSLVKTLLIHSRELVYWYSQLDVPIQKEFLEAVLHRLQSIPLIQFFDRTSLPENPQRLPTPLRFASTTPILPFVQSDQFHLRFCMVSSFTMVNPPRLFHVLETAPSIDPFLSKISLNKFLELLHFKFSPFDAYRFESIVKAMSTLLVVRSLVEETNEIKVSIQDVVFGYLAALCKINKLDCVTMTGKMGGKPKLYVRGEDNFEPIEL